VAKGSCETKNMKPGERLFNRNKTLNKSLEKWNWPYCICIFRWDFAFGDAINLGIKL